jgi:hypothetical protein
VVLFRPRAQLTPALRSQTLVIGLGRNHSALISPLPPSVISDCLNYMAVSTKLSSLKCALPSSTRPCLCSLTYLLRPWVTQCSNGRSGRVDVSG